MNKNIVLCGVGGQGTVLASKLMAAAAMKKNIPVMTAETIGMAQRGGSVFSHLRMGEGIYSPMAARGTADLIIGFEPGETVRMLPFLKKGGTVVVSSRPIMPVSASIGDAVYRAEDMIAYLKQKVSHLIIIDSQRAVKELGSSKVLNVVLLGAAVRSGELGLTLEDIQEAIQSKVPEKFHELNIRALNYAE